jgi:hypothetical protein
MPDLFGQRDVQALEISKSCCSQATFLEKQISDLIIKACLRDVESV